MDCKGRFFLGKAFCVLSLFMFSIMMSLTSWVHAADVSEINVKLEALQKEVAELKAGSVAKENLVTGGGTKGSIKLPGTNTSITIGGFAKGVLLWSDKSAGTLVGDQALVPFLIPVGPTAGQNEKSQINFQARQSQLWFRTVTPSEYGRVVSHIEGDFFAPNLQGTENITNAHGLRIRQAYGSIGHLTVGQFWSTVTSFTAMPEFLDFGGPVSIVGTRQVGIRWTQAFNGGSYSIAAENPETYLSGTTAVNPDDDKFPDITGIVTFKVGKNTFDAAGVVRFLRIDVPGTVESETGWGTIFSGNIPTFGKDELKFQVHRGEGLGRYIGGVGTMTDGVLIGGKIEKITTTGGYLAYRHFWAPKFRSTLMLATVKATDPPGSPATLTNRTSSVHLNLVWAPVASVQIGPEYIYGERRIESGLSGHINRVQFSARYDFF